MTRHQTGYIWRIGRSWYGRWREDVIEGGAVVHKQRSEKLANVCDRYSTKADVRPVLEEKLRSINQGRVTPESTLTVAEYVEQFYLPHAKDNCKPSTYSGYKTQWEIYLAPWLRQTALRDFRTADAAKVLDDVHRVRGLRRSTLRHLKSFLSGAFSFALNQGVLNGINPVREARITKKAAASAETYAATPDEVLAMMDVLEKAGNLKARAAVALMFFAGLRPGEARGARWEDYDGRQLFVRQSIWGTNATAPKTADSAKPVPIIEPLRSVLAELRKAEGNPESGPILRGAKAARPLNLDNLARREVRDLVAKAGIAWHGWYSLRRGVATTMQRLEKDPMAAKGLLRHASVLTTQRHYIKDVPETTMSAMRKLEALCKDCAKESQVKPS